MDYITVWKNANQVWLRKATKFIYSCKIIFFWPCSLSADIVEGMVNKGIYVNGDNGATFLHFGNYKNSCISEPSKCVPQGKSDL